MQTAKNRPQQKEVIMMQDETKKVANSLVNMESMFSSKPNCCIYTVPDFIRKGNEKCYRPLFTSIGPVFYNRPELAAMQELKWMALKYSQTYRRDNNACRGYEPYIEYVREHKREIQDCYQQKINVPSDEFIEMMVLDATFLVFLLHDAGQFEKSLENKFRGPIRCLKQDLFVEENQLPFFVLKKFYEIAFGGDNSSSVPFINLALDFIRNYSTEFPRCEAIHRIKVEKKIDASTISHLLHLRMQCCLLEGQKPHDDVIESRVDLSRICCYNLSFNKLHDPEDKLHYSHEFYSVKQLTAAGVRFKLNDQPNNLFDIKFDKKSGVLKIPKITLADFTESVFRSILFFEQNHEYKERYFTDYFIFLDDLIDDVEDIRILQQNKILHNDLGSDKEAAILINKLNKYNTYDSSQFAFCKVHNELKGYASTCWNRWKTILWNRYFNHPWSIISVIAAIILFILTLLQTITSFLQLPQK